MEETLHFLMQHGHIVLFIWIFIDQFGLPLPVAPLLLAAGALTGKGQIEPLMAVLIPAIASFSSSIFWYEMGRIKGTAILGLICKIALEPDTYVLRSENAFLRYGKLSLLFAKFIPGMNAISACVAGVFNLSRPAFLLLNALGSCLWAGTFVGAGYLFRHQLEEAATRVGSMGSYLFTVLSMALIAYVGFRYIRRYRATRALRGDRITPEELKQKLDEKANVIVIDLRHPLDAQQVPGTVPGAIRIAPDEVPHRHGEIPANGEIVLYCSCPNEATSAQVARKLNQLGYRQVRPLIGGLDAWHKKGFPLAVETHN